jgi:uncharacterized protein YjdB
MKRFFYYILAAFLVFSCEKTPEEITVSSLSLSQSSMEMLIGETMQLSATVQPSNATNKTVMWASTNPSVASVDQSGKVTALAEGKATITASAGGKSATCLVNVSKKYIAVTSVELDHTSLEMTEEDVVTLIATVKPDDATDKTVTWSSSDATVATVDNGKVTAIKEGEAIITATAGSKAATCKVTVLKKVIEVSSVELNKETLELVEGDSETLVATVKPDDATDKTVTWTSSNNAVASVDQNGKVTALAEGKATITASAGGKSATCLVNVRSANIEISVKGHINTLEAPASIQSIVPTTQWKEGCSISVLHGGKVYEYVATTNGLTTSFTSTSTDILMARPGETLFAVAPASVSSNGEIEMNNTIDYPNGNDLSSLPTTTLRGVGTVDSQGRITFEFSHVYAYLCIALTQDIITAMNHYDFRIIISGYGLFGEGSYNIVKDEVTSRSYSRQSGTIQLGDNSEDVCYYYFPVFPEEINNQDISIYKSSGDKVCSTHVDMMTVEANHVYLLEFQKGDVSGGNGGFEDIPIFEW